MDSTSASLQNHISISDVITASKRVGFEVEKFENGIVVYGHHAIGDYEEELILNIVNGHSISEQLYKKYKQLQSELIQGPSDYSCMRLLCMSKFMKAFKPVLYDYEPFPSDDNALKIMIVEIMACIYGIEILNYDDENEMMKMYCFPYATKSFGEEEYSFVLNYDKPICEQVYSGVNNFHPLKGHKMATDLKKARKMADELSEAARPLKQFAHDLRTIFNEETRKDWMHDFTNYLTAKDVEKRNATVMSILKKCGYNVKADSFTYTMSVPELEYDGHFYITSGCMKEKDALAFAYSFLKMFSENSVKEMISNDPFYFEQLGDEEYILSLPVQLSNKADIARKALDEAFYKWNDWA